ncbi:unnamed protein product [Adineta ricciae]|uniref:Uncharacterized protein n=2 Tax=Adineta ricciae TaxID=249248 RepID=A0A815KTV2_ADIRI|nr:unnamed protein product [Adineta ricciae]
MISLAFIVLITGIVGGLLIVFSILFLYKYCVNRKNLREAAQMKLLYETLHPAMILDSNRIYRHGMDFIPPLEPRRSNPLDRYQLPQNQWQIPSSKPSSLDYHENHEQNGNTQHNPTLYENVSNDEKPAENYLQVDPRCYVRQNSTSSVILQKRSETPRLEKGHSINIDTRPSGTSSSLSPYRQSSFDVTLAYHTPTQQPSTPSSIISTPQEMFFTPRGSSLSVHGNSPTSTPQGSQHLLPPVAIISKKPTPIEKKDLTVQLNSSSKTSNNQNFTQTLTSTRSSVVQREHEHCRSLEHPTTASSSSVDKQSRSFDAANLLRPVNQRSEAVVNRRTKSYECAEEHHSSSPIAPPPIIIKIPDMSQLVQAAQLEHKKRKDFWRFHRSHDIEDRRDQVEQTSPDDLFTSTSIDSSGGIHSPKKMKNENPNDENPNYEHRRKSSSNLLLPPPEVRRQALRRTFEKRRNCINQSNAKREEQLNNKPTSDFSKLLTNLTCRSENSSFDRSLETDFDMQSDTSSRGQNDHFTSIESSGNEYNISETNSQHLKIQPTTQQDDSAYKSFESQNQTLSLDWMSTDGGESVIFIPQSSLKQRSVDIKDLEEDLNETQRNLSQNQYLSPNKSIPLSASIHRTASKKRREFSKDKRHASSNVILPSMKTPDEHEQNSNQTLQVRSADLRRSKSNEAEILEYSINSLDTNVSSNSIPTRTNITPNPRHLFQKSPSVSVSSPTESFRSKRGSISFDYPTVPINSPSPSSSVAPIVTTTSGTKPRLKFSLVRDPTTSSLGSTSSNNSMLLFNDNAIDEKTDRIINEFLKQDNHQRAPIRQQTFDETNHQRTKQQTRTTFIKQRPHSFIQSDFHSEYPSTHLTDQEKYKCEDQPISSRTSNFLRRENGLAFGSPSIIVTGYDSGS